MGGEESCYKVRGYDSVFKSRYTFLHQWYIYIY